MSLAILADHMASKGRGPDSMLVHMSPREVRGLQALAKQHGGTLTVNPETGLPEAGFLDKLLPTILGVGATVLSGGTITPLMAGLGVGAIQAARTGDLGKGLMAGLGAYGGAGLAESFMGAGASALTSEAAAQSAMSANAEAAAQLGAEANARDILMQRAAIGDVAAASPWEKLSAGAKAAFDSPTAAAEFAKANWKPAAAALSPILADEMVKSNMPTTTTRPGQIRRFSYNPYDQYYTSLGAYDATPVSAADGGLMSLASGGQFDWVGKGESVVRMADGGPAPGSDAYNKMVGDWFAAYPNATAADVQSAISTYNLNPADVLSAMQASGLSAAAQYSAFHPDVGTPNTPFGGIAELTHDVKDWVAAANAADQYTPADKRQMALDAMNQYGYNMADIVRATGMTVDELFPDVKQRPIGVTPTGFYGNETNPGDITYNVDGTSTVQPNIPYRPEGGFSGMSELRDAYTRGGGSLGYIPYAPKTIEEFNAKYNKLTGGSKQAYDYLMGTSPYSPTPWTPTGEVMKPYSEAVLGMPIASSSKKYLFDPATKTYQVNPDYIPVTYTEKGEKILGLPAKDIKAQLSDMATSDYEKWMLDNNVTHQQIADALGISLAEARKRYPLTNAAKEAIAKIEAADSVGGDSGGVGGGGSGSSGTGPGDAGAATDGAGDAGASATGGGSAAGADGDSSGPGDLATGGLLALARGGVSQFNLGDYSDGGRLLRGPGDGVSDSIPATIGKKRPARLADGEFVIPARIVSELGNGSTEAGARKLYAMMDRVQKARRNTTGKNKVAKDTRAAKYLPA